MNCPRHWPELAADEWPTIASLAALAQVDPCFIGAIRQAENGGPGREFGVLTVGADTFVAQCRICCHTIVRYLSEFPGNPLRYVVGMRLDTVGGYIQRRLLYSPTFIEFAANRYAPRGAANDPHGLNQHWFDNVRKWYMRLVDE